MNRLFCWWMILVAAIFLQRGEFHRHQQQKQSSRSSESISATHPSSTTQRSSAHRMHQKEGKKWMWRAMMRMCVCPFVWWERCEMWRKKRYIIIPAPDDSAIFAKQEMNAKSCQIFLKCASVSFFRLPCASLLDFCFRFLRQWFLCQL